MTIEIDITVGRDGFRLEAACTLAARVSGLYGASGSGKTTLLHAIAGLVRPQRGRIAVAGRVLFDSRAGTCLPVQARRIGMMFQDARLFPHLCVRRNLTYGARGRDAEGLRIDLGTVVELLELRPLLARRPAQLSGGEQRRVALGRCLLSGPALLLLDEPLSGVDGGLRRQIIPFLRRVRDEVNVPMLYVSHDLSELLQMTGDLLVLDRGRVAGSGRYVDLVQQEHALGVIHDLGLVNVFEIEPDGAGGHRLAGGGPSIVVQAAAAGAGGRLVVAIRPEDVALALEPIEMISIRNQIRGQVCRVARGGDHGDHGHGVHGVHGVLGGHGGVIVEVDIGRPLLVEITAAALERLEIRPGRSVWCLFKASAVRVV